MATAKRSSKPDEGQEAKRSAALAKANERRRETSALKADARSARLSPAALLSDERAAPVKVLTLLTMIPRCTQRVALEALLICQINGARTCAELTDGERKALGATISQIGHGIVVPPRRTVPGQSEGADRELDRALNGTRRSALEVELAPSEFAAARTGFEIDPLLLRMVDRLVDALRLYVEQDDGGQRARVVLEQWIRACNYRDEVARGECPPPTQRRPAKLE
jgi:hypothetical protein